MGKFEQIGNGFYLDGKKFNVHSGTIHYFRFRSEQWRDRLSKLKEAGFNTVETYIAWNMHERKKGTFDFEGANDIVLFLLTAKELGLYTIVRPGPYICAEWDFGGMPGWLLAEKIDYRCSSEPFVFYCKRYLKAVFDKIKPLLITNGGNVIMMQVENEYGSYGNDKKYLEILRDFYRENGIDVLLITSDGVSDNMLSGGSVEGCLPTLNFGSDVKGNYEKFLSYYGNSQPFMCTEFWCGWFDHWGEKHQKPIRCELCEEIEAFLKLDGNFNLYMFCGGTNFGFNSGCNFEEKLYPTVTSYDYGAPLTESGDYTDVYFKIRELMSRYTDLPIDVLPKSPEYQYIGRVDLPKCATLKANRGNIGYKFKSVCANNLESYGFSQGMIEYKSVLPGKYEIGSEISVEGIGDRAYIWENGERLAVFDRSESEGRNAIATLKNADRSTIRVLVDTYGHVNYGKYIEDPKGIEAVYIGQQKLFNYEIVCYPLDNLDKLSYDGGNTYPLFLKGSFVSPEKKDCFVHMDGFTKGAVWVNGFNLGRFWNKGPQLALYLPAPLLRDENEIIVMETDGFSDPYVLISDKPALG